MMKWREKRWRNNKVLLYLHLRKNQRRRKRRDQRKKKKKKKRRDIKMVTLLVDLKTVMMKIVINEDTLKLF